VKRLDGVLDRPARAEASRGVGRDETCVGRVGYVVTEEEEDGHYTLGLD